MDEYYPQCTGKVKHKNKASARKAIAIKRDDLKIYKCDICGFFHIGSGSPNRFIAHRGNIKRRKAQRCNKK